jgi:tape measure domain-containing protein
MSFSTALGGSLVSKEVRQIDIKVTTDGAPEVKRMANEIGGMNRNVKRLAGDVGFLTNAFTSMLAAFSIREIVGIADSMQSLENRIKVFTGSSESASKTMSDLRDVANRTKTSVDALATTYSRFAVSAKEAGLDSDQLLMITEAIQNTFRISGATVEEAAGAQVQFSQALARGALRGQELISVLSQNAEYANLLSESLGVTRGQLLKMAETGQLTTNKVLKPLFTNFNAINGKAAALGQTFGQTLTVAMNDLKIGLNELNKEFKLSEKFATVVNTLTGSIQGLTLALAALLALKLPALFAGLQTVITGFAALNPWIRGAILLGSALSFLAFKFGDLQTAWDTFARSLPSVGRWADDFADTNKWVKYVGVLRDSLTLLGKLKDAKLPTFKPLAETNRDLLADLKSRENKRVVLPNLKDQTSEADKLKDILKELNALYLAGSIGVEEYFNRLNVVKQNEANRAFKDGATDLLAYKEALIGIEKTEINKTFQDSSIAVGMFNDRIAANKMDELNIQLEAGKISLYEYDDAVVKLGDRFRPEAALRSGAYAFFSQVETTSEFVAKSVTTVFNGLEDHLVEFTKKGKANFTEFAQSVLDEVNRMVIRMAVLKPLAQGVSGSSEGIAGFFSNLFSSGTGAGAAGATSGGISSGPATYMAPFANGGAFLNGAKRFASGGILNSPTAFSYGSGNLGLAGEAGSEAIMPLSRGSGGKLGVHATSSPVIVNINNNAPVDVTTQETSGPNGEKQIELLIRSKVKESLQNGSLDKTFQSNYGIRRRGN